MSNIITSIFIPFFVSMISSFSILIFSEKYKKRIDIHTMFLSKFIELKYGGMPAEKLNSLVMEFGNLERTIQESIYISKQFRIFLRNMKEDAGINPDQLIHLTNPISDYHGFKTITKEQLLKYSSDSNLKALKNIIDEETSYSKSLEFLLGINKN